MAESSQVMVKRPSLAVTPELISKVRDEAAFEVALGVAVALGVLVGRGVGVAVGFGVFVGLGVGLAVGLGVGVAVTRTVGVAGAWTVRGQYRPSAQPIDRSVAAAPGR